MDALLQPILAMIGIAAAQLGAAYAILFMLPWQKDGGDSSRLRWPERRQP